MSRFYASIRGSARTEATRQGGKDSGIISHTRGWDVGVKVSGRIIEVGSEDLGDKFSIYATAGSNGAYSDRYLGVVTLGKGGAPTFTPAGRGARE